MRENEKYFDAAKIVDEALKSKPNFTLPDNFAEMVAEKVSRKFAWQQYVTEFLIYLGAFVGIAMVSVAIALIWYDTNWKEWLDLIDLYRANSASSQQILYCLIESTKTAIFAV